MCKVFWLLAPYCGKIHIHQFVLLNSFAGGMKTPPIKPYVMALSNIPEPKPETPSRRMKMTKFTGPRPRKAVQLLLGYSYKSTNGKSTTRAESMNNRIPRYSRQPFPDWVQGWVNYHADASFCCPSDLAWLSCLMTYSYVSIVVVAAGTARIILVPIPA